MNDVKICVYFLLAFSLQMIRKCEGGTESEPTLECLEESDPMGERYRGTISQTKSGVECQRWDTDERHTRHDKPKDLDNNYCRNPNPDENTSRLPWCYTTSNTWEYCSIKICSPCTGMRYENKCFVAVEKWIDYDGAAAECESRGWKLANLYSQKHMNDIMKYIEEQERFDGHHRFRTGMIFDPMANKLTLRDGTDGPDGLKWSPASSLIPAVYPSTGARYADYTNVILIVIFDSSLINRPPTDKDNVLCEFE